MKSAIVAGDYNELPPAVVAMEAGLRWRRLDDDVIAAVVASSHVAEALGVAAEQIVAAVREAGREACQNQALEAAAHGDPRPVRGTEMNDISAAQLDASPADDRGARTSPEYVRISMARRDRLADALGPVQP